MVRHPVVDKLTSGQPVLLDGPTGTELERLGYATRLPQWTALAPRDAPQLLRQIHHEYVQAGAEIVTACTFRTSRHTLAKIGHPHEAAELTREAVEIARQCTVDCARPIAVAGSVAPLEDCYHPGRTPDSDTLDREHAHHVEALARAGVDLLLVETMPTRREAVAAARAALRSGLLVVTSFIVEAGGALFDGSSLDEAIDAVAEVGVEVVCVNCASSRACTLAMGALESSGLVFGAYANASDPDGSFGRQLAPAAPSRYGREAAAWLARGASLVGGCCGTTSVHIATMRQLIDTQDRKL